MPPYQRNEWLPTESNGMNTPPRRFFGRWATIVVFLVVVGFWAVKLVSNQSNLVGPSPLRKEERIDHHSGSPRQQAGQTLVSEQQGSKDIPINDKLLIDTPIQYLFISSDEGISPSLRVIQAFNLTNDEVHFLKREAGEIVTRIREETKAGIKPHAAGDPTNTYFDILPMAEALSQQMKGDFVKKLSERFGDEKGSGLAKYFGKFAEITPSLRGFGSYKLRLGFSTLSGYGSGMQYTETILNRNDEIIYGCSKQSLQGIPEQYKAIFKSSE